MLTNMAQPVMELSLPSNPFLPFKTIPQVLLLYAKSNMLNNITAQIIIKTIICLDKDNVGSCDKENLCRNCFKIKNNTYLDFKTYHFANDKIMSKSTILDIVSDFSKTSLEQTNIKIYVINEISYASINASNTMLKILEDLPSNVYIIFTTTNINNILSTIKSRSQLLNCDNNKEIINSINDDSEQLLIKLGINETRVNSKLGDDLLSLVITFINKSNDSNNKNDIVLLASQISKLKTEINYFFKFLTLLLDIKLKLLYDKKNDFNNKLVTDLIRLWKLNDINGIITCLQLISEVLSRLKFNVNLTLLVNFFLVKVSEIL